MRITVNGKAHDVDADAIEYEALVELAGMTGTPSMTWRAGKDSGILHPGDGAFVVEGLVVNAAHTGNA